MSQTSHDVLIELHSPDFKITKEFYSKLGFEIVWEEEPKEMNGYLVMRRRNSILCFFCGNEHVYNHPYFKKFQPDTPRGYGVEFSIPVENIDTFYTDIRKIIPEHHFVQELRLQPWGIKDFRMVDPFGYYFRVNEPSDIINLEPLGDKSYNS